MVAIIIGTVLFLLFPSPVGWREAKCRKPLQVTNEVSVGLLLPQSTLPRSESCHGNKLGYDATFIHASRWEAWRVTVLLKLYFPISYLTSSKTWKNRKTSRSESRHTSILFPPSHSTSFRSASYLF